MSRHHTVVNLHDEAWFDTLLGHRSEPYLNLARGGKSVVVDDERLRIDDQNPGVGAPLS
jgi:hypothetical protein